MRVFGTASAARPQRTSANRTALVLAFALSLPARIPLVSVLASLLTPQASIWAHLAEHVLPDVVLNTLKLVLGVGLAAGVLGTALAWLTSMFEFPGRRLFDWALLLPL